MTNDPLADLVSKFSAALLERLRASEDQHGGHNDWMRDHWQAECQRKLLERVSDGDPLSVAGYAAFCWHHGWPSA